MNDDITSEILTDVENIVYIYHIVKEAGSTAMEKIRKEKLDNKLTVIVPYERGMNRVSSEGEQTTEYRINYDHNRMTIIGGAALSIYDYKFEIIKKKRKMLELHEYIKKKTADIDINWWPDIPNTNKIIVSKSKGIIKLVDYFVEELEKNLNKHHDELLTRISPHIAELEISDTITFKVNSFHTWQAGVFNITVYFLINNMSLKICDINVHDGGSAQKFNSDGYQIRDLRPMSDDPTYCSPYDAEQYSVIKVKVNNIDVMIPNIISFVKQQLFAFSNLMRNNNSKALVNYRRVEFIYRILLNIYLNEGINSPIYRNLSYLFGTAIRHHLMILLNQIERMISIYIEKNITNIFVDCHSGEIIDETLIELFDKANQILERERGELILLLETKLRFLQRKQKDNKYKKINKNTELITRTVNLIQKLEYELGVYEFLDYINNNQAFVEYSTLIEDIDILYRLD